MSKIEFSSDANAYRITLNDPPLHILDIAMLEELRDALGKVNNDRHCLIITASGEKSFSAGAKWRIRKSAGAFSNGWSKSWRKWQWPNRCRGSRAIRCTRS